MRIGTNVWPGYEPLYLARDLGYFDERSVKLIEHTSASQVIRSFRNGELDAAALTLDEVLALAETGYDPRIILVMDISDGGDVVIGRAGIADMEQLKGKRIAVEASALGAYVLTRALEQSNMTLEEITVVETEYNRHEQQFNDQAVDAVVTFEPVRSRLLAQGGNLLFDSSQIPGEIVDVLVVRAEYLDKNPDRGRELVKHWFSALEHMEKHHDDAVSRIAKRLELSPEEVSTSYEGLILPKKQANHAYLVGTSGVPALMDTAQRLSKVMKASRLLRKDVDARSLFASTNKIFQ